MLDIENLTVKELREVATLACALSGQPLSAPPLAGHAGDCYPYKPGDIVLLMTVTMWFVGRLKAFDSLGFAITEAAWIADTGRFNEALANGTAVEVEPFQEGVQYIGRGSLIACTPFKATLRVVK